MRHQMGLAWEEIQKNSIRFSKDWKDASREIAEGQGFVTDLLGTFGVNIHDIDNKEGGFEFPVKRPNLASKLSVDFLWKGKIAIEMKSKGKDLNYAYVQLKNYMQYLPEDDIPDLWVVCDFEKMQVYRLSTNERWHFNISALHRNVNLFYDITGLEAKSPRKELPEVNVLAAEKMAQLHDKLRKNHYTGHALEVYLVRLLFCLFADHTGIFYDDSFYNFIDKSKKDGSDLSFRLEKLFETLNTPHKSRFQNSFISKDLKDFTYVNGKLFADTLPLPDFDSDIRKLLIECTNFNWSNISPAIFGAMFQGVMDKVRRRELGAHYTSEENILKVIKPLFLDALWEEFKNVKTSNKGLEKLHAKISQIRFLDPACGCGNFLIITYREIRKLEMEILKLLYRSQQPLIPDVACKVSLAQFYGIECEDFPCQIAQVGMWLVDHQMNMVLSEQFGIFAKNLPLVKSANIVCKNALQYDWGTLLPKSDSKNQST
ncbi:MAG: class I SAM-dependent DNA methyltransferase, partial [Deltaproteobacteria bacterium]|nr:class I SAM-dependent DNA methyltransferase [Deltaproteobacteria bacterium]